MPPPRRRHTASNNVAIWIGTASLIAGGLAWAYYTMRDGSSTNSSTNTSDATVSPGEGARFPSAPEAYHSVLYKPRDNATSASRGPPAAMAKPSIGKGKRPVLTVVLRTVRASSALSIQYVSMLNFASDTGALPTERSGGPTRLVLHSTARHTSPLVKLDTVQRRRPSDCRSSRCRRHPARDGRRRHTRLSGARRSDCDR
jgi:hypothetical protein